MGGLVAHPVGAYLGFFGWKRLRVYQLPLWVDSRSLAFPVSSLAWYFLYFWMEALWGTEALWGSSVLFKNTIDWPGYVSNPDLSTRSPPSVEKIGSCQENGSLIPDNFRSHVFFHSFFIDQEPWTDYKEPVESGKIPIFSALLISLSVLFVAILPAVTEWKTKINQMEKRWTRRRYVGVNLRGNLCRL